MDKKKLLLVLVSVVFLGPLVIAFLSHAFGFINPGLFGGIAMLLGAGYFIYWVKSNRVDDNIEQPTKGSP